MISLRRSAPAWGACLLLAFASDPTVGQAQQPASATEENRRIVKDAFARWSAGGSGFFDEVLADDVVWTIEGSSPSAVEYKGRQALIEHAVRPLAMRLRSPVRPKIVRIWADGDHVIANWKGQGVAQDGQRYQNSYAWIFRMQAGKAVEVTAFLDLAPYDDVLRRIPAATKQEEKVTQSPYLGMWVTEDGCIRQELLPNGRYDEARGARQHAYQGRYEIKGNHIDYWDDTGFTADGQFVDANTLHHGGMIFRRLADPTANPCAL
jgi:ketosteroid isomerase-like protein